MRPERLEKVIPLALISIFAVLIGFRVTGVIPSILATGEFEVSRTIFVDAGIGGLLSVLAIVISLTLMGIQFASQEYTHRVMNTYLKSYMLWSMIGIYLATILYNLYMTAFLKIPVDTTYADVSVMLQSLCLIMLIPHFVIAVIHLRPDFTINIIVNSVDEEYILAIENFIQTGKGQVPTNVDRLLPAVEIIEKSISRGDRATVRVALDELYNCYRKFVNPENEAWIPRYFLDYLLRIGREAIMETDDDSLVQILDILGEIGSSSSAIEVVHLVIDDISIIGLGALKKDFEAAVEQTVDSFQLILKSSTGEETSNKIFDSLDELSEQLFSMDKKRLIRYLIGRLSGLTEMAVERKDSVIITKWSTVLEEIGRNVVIRKQRAAVHETIQAFYQMGILGAKNELDVTRYAIEPLLRIERELSPDDRELISEVEYARKEIEKSTQKHTPSGEGEGSIDTKDLW